MCNDTFQLRTVSVVIYLSRPELWEKLCDTWQCFGSIFLHDASKREGETIWFSSSPHALTGTVSF